MNCPDKIQDCGLPIFYTIYLVDGTSCKARFDPHKNAWITQGKNVKIVTSQVVRWEKSGQVT